VRSHSHALVIGKFYPPHAGHEYLIRAAADAARNVTVVVMACDVESIPLDLRVAWLEEMLADRAHVCVVGVVDNVPVDYESDAIWTAHVELMHQGVAAAERSRAIAAGPVDVVFTSEGYGDELARRFGATAMCVDPNRERHCVSGTAVRRDPIAHWNQLAPCVRAFLCRRFVLVGAESTGKTTLAAALAARLRERGGVWHATQWVEEYGREYTIDKLADMRRREPSATMDALQWTSPEFELIAREQQHREDRAARTSGPVLICDTDAFATALWHERYTGTRSASVEAIAATSSARAGYILTGLGEVPFEQDGLGDGESIRGWMHGAFEARLRAQSMEWITAAGSLGQRVAQCEAWIDRKLANAWRFAAPLG
jgi:NadR type nicotinamide-nucleotide adenylyltransferase